jgi:hypothetical protein
MKKIAALIAALAVAAPLAIPAIASASTASTQAYVGRQFSTQIRNRARLSGFHVTSTSVRCASDGGGYYSCWSTYTLMIAGTHMKYGEYLNVTPTRWYATSNGRLLNSW